MVTVLRFLVVMLACWTLTATPAPGEDLRATYGTPNLAAARCIGEGMQAMSQGQMNEALEQFNQALKHDPRSGFAFFQRGMVHSDQGRIEQALADWQRCIDLDTIDSSVSIHAAINGGLTHVQMQKYEQACRWFTQAVLLDPTDRYGVHWKAYRNMALALERCERPLAAAYAALRAYQADRRHVEIELVRKLLANASGEPREDLKLLWLEADRTELSARETPGEVSQVASGGPECPERVHRILADPGSDNFLLFGRGVSHYYLASPGKTWTVRRIDVKRAIGGVTVLPDRRVYVTLANPGEIVQLNPSTGETKSVRALGKLARATALAMLPEQGLGFVVAGEKLYRIPLSGEAATDLDIPADDVAASPCQQFLYVCHQPLRGAVPRAGMVIIAGRPVYVQPRDPFAASQTSLMQFVLAEGKLFFAEERLHAASNASQVVVDPRGRFVTLPGGGGWRPRDDQGHGAGYGAAVYHTGSVVNLLGFFASKTYPHAAAFNPVTDQVAVVAAKETRVYRLADPKTHQQLDAEDGREFGYAAAFSGDGRWLLVARNDKGVCAFEVPRTASEKDRAGRWASQVKTAPRTRRVYLDPGERMEWVAAFRAKDTAKAVGEMLDAAFSARRTRRPTVWFRCRMHALNGPRPEDLFELDARSAAKDAGGVVLYRLGKLAESWPRSAPVRYYQGLALHRSGQLDAAEEAYRSVLALDAGQTELSPWALDALHDIHVRNKQPLAAMHCLAASLRIDLADPVACGKLVAMLRAHEMTAQADRLGETFRKLTGTAPAAGSAELPKLLPAPEGKARSAEAIYDKSAPSVALLRNGTSSGSAVCVAAGGWFLTNAHVVGDARTVELIAYDHTAAAPKARKPVTARLVRLWKDADLALLHAEALADKAVPPLPVADGKAVRPGQKIFAIGHPGLGDQVLENTISEGIVSAVRRKVEGLEVMQHTAAINPGNSGGPLLNDRGQIVGINVLRGRLESVGFAVPAEVILQKLPR